MLALGDGEKNEVLEAWAAAAHGQVLLAGGERVSHAGLDYELEGDTVGCERVARVARAWAPPAASASSAAAADSAAPKFAVRCRLHLLPAQPITRAAPRGGLVWSWGTDGGRLHTRWAGARVWQAAGGFDGVAWLADDARAPHELLGGLTVMLTRRLGGGAFHAASVVLDGRVIAFVGPSGAGKSTACRHVEHAPLFSVDRLALLPAIPSPAALSPAAALLPAALLPAALSPALPPLAALSSPARLREPLLPPAPSPAAPFPRATAPLPAAEPRWFAHPLPGGTRPVPDLPNAEHRWLPLAGVLRVQRSTSETAIVIAPPARAVMLLRESTFQAGLGPHTERELLAALDDLAQRVPVARLELRLGTRLTPFLRRWLVDQERK